MALDLDEQYDKLYRYCYFKVGQRETAEDITQEAFLRFLEHSDYADSAKAMQYLYTIAHRLCVDEYRRKKPASLEEASGEAPAVDAMLDRLSVRIALSQMEEAERELLLLRYVNEVPITVICKLYDISRFAAYRRISKAVRHLKDKLREEENT